MSPEKFRKFLDRFHKNLPKLRRLCFKLNEGLDQVNIAESLSKNPEYDQILQKFAFERNVTIEIVGMPVYDLRHVLEVVNTTNGFKIFNPVQGEEDLEDEEDLDEEDLGEEEGDSDEEDELDEEEEDGKGDEGDD